MEFWIHVLFGGLTMVAAIIGARQDREEREADARYDAFQRALAERERRDAAESADPPSDLPA